MPRCAFKCYHDYHGKKKLAEISFHRIPVEKRAKEKWVQIIRESINDPHWQPTIGSVVCSLHFDDDEFYRTLTGHRWIVRNSLPKKRSRPKVEDRNPTEPLNDLETDTKLECTDCVLKIDIEQDITDTAESTVKLEEDYNANEFNVKSTFETFPTFAYTHKKKETEPSKDNKQIQESLEICVKKKVSLQTDIGTEFDDKLLIYESNSSSSKSGKQFKLNTEYEYLNKIRNLQQNLRRFHSRNIILKKRIKEFKMSGKDELTDHPVANELINLLKCRKAEKPTFIYTPALRNFCLALNSLSPKAYDFVRSTFDECLPNNKTLSKWKLYVKGSLQDPLNQGFLVPRIEYPPADTSLSTITHSQFPLLY